MSIHQTGRQPAHCCSAILRAANVPTVWLVRAVNCLIGTAALRMPRSCPTLDPLSSARQEAICQAYYTHNVGLTIVEMSAHVACVHWTGFGTNVLRRTTTIKNRLHMQRRLTTLNTQHAARPSMQSLLS